MVKTTILTPPTAFCSEAHVQELVCEPGEQLPPEDGKALSEREKVRRAIVAVCKDMRAARTEPMDAIAQRQAVRINALGAAGRYANDAALKALYEASMEDWAPAPVVVEEAVKDAGGIPGEAIKWPKGQKPVDLPPLPPDDGPAVLGESE